MFASSIALDHPLAYPLWSYPAVLSQSQCRRCTLTRNFPRKDGAIVDIECWPADARCFDCAPCRGPARWAGAKPGFMILPSARGHTNWLRSSIFDTENGRTKRDTAGSPSGHAQQPEPVSGNRMTQRAGKPTAQGNRSTLATRNEQPQCVDETE